MNWDEKLNAYIDRNQAELLRILSRLCAIASVATQRSAENAPYGPECRRVLDEALQICRDYGFITHDDDGYAGHARMGSQQACIGVMTHLDVVPAGQGWETDPFCLNVRDGKAFARGAVDNKGPAAATILPCMRCRPAVCRFSAVYAQFSAVMKKTVWMIWCIIFRTIRCRFGDLRRMRNIRLSIAKSTSFMRA